MARISSADPAISTNIGRGATILTAYAERQVKAYPIFETELDSISFLNTQVLVYFSVGSALLSFAVGIWTNAAFAENLTPAGTLLARVAGPLLCVASAAAYLLGLNARRSRVSQWMKIKQESVSGV